MARNFGLNLVPRHITKDLHIYCHNNLRYVTRIVRSADFFRRLQYVRTAMLIVCNNRNEPVMLTVNTLITRHSTPSFIGRCSMYGHR
jgi:hypothetical protein